MADGHEMYADTKYTAHGLAMISFVFAPAAGEPNRCSNSTVHRSMTLDLSLHEDCVLRKQHKTVTKQNDSTIFYSYILAIPQGINDILK